MFQPSYSGIKPPVNVRWLIYRALFGNMKWRLIVHIVQWAATSLLVTKRTKTDFLLQEVDFMHSSATALWRPRVNTKSRRKYIDAAERFQGATTVFEVFKDPLLFSKWNLTWAILISPPVFACCDDAATRFSICHQNSYRWQYFCFFLTLKWTHGSKRCFFLKPRFFLVPQPFFLNPTTKCWWKWLVFHSTRSGDETRWPCRGERGLQVQEIILQPACWQTLDEHWI